MVPTGCTGTCVTRSFKGGECLTLKSTTGYLRVACVVLGQRSLDATQPEQTKNLLDGREPQRQHSAELRAAPPREAVVAKRDLSGRDNVQTGLCYPLSTDCTGQAVAMNGPSNGASNMTTRCVRAKREASSA